MKHLIFLLITTLLFLNQNAQSQTKNHLVDGIYHQWKWNEHDCFNKWSVTFENKTQQTITSVTFRLVIKEKESGFIRYKKTHTVNFTLNANEIVPSPYFYLSQELCNLKNPNDLEGYFFFTEVISFK